MSRLPMCGAPESGSDSSRNAQIARFCEGNGTPAPCGASLLGVGGGVSEIMRITSKLVEGVCPQGQTVGLSDCG